MPNGTDIRLSAARRRPSIMLFTAMAILLSTHFFTAAPASAGDAFWSAETIPGATDLVIGRAGIDLRDIAVASDGNTIFAVPGDSITDDVIYRSTDTGESWDELAVDIAADLVAIAPDDDGTVAIADSAAARVYVTTNAGLSWYDLGVPGEGASIATAVYDIAISEAASGVNYIAVAGTDGASMANVWYFKLGATGASWRGTAALPGFSAASRAAAVAFSPDFSMDESVAAITENDGDSVRLQVFVFDNEMWNASAGLVLYPLAIISSSGLTGLDSASLSLAPDYDSNSEDLRTAFIGLAVAGGAADVTASGIYRVENDQVKALKTGVSIHSIAYNGKRLVAGSYQVTTVYRSLNPRASSPTVSYNAALKEPGGAGRVVVAWAGNDVAAGTSGNESAFAISRDYGAAFNDISLIDTAIKHARDVAVAADGDRVYLATADDNDLSLWRKDTNWERVLSRQGITDGVVRLAPENDAVVYVARKGGEEVFQNDTAGNGKWSARTCVFNIQDLEVVSAGTAYALSSSGSVSKTTNSGTTWGADRPTGLISGATISCPSQDVLLVGSQDGYVAYSTDGNASWTRITVQLDAGADRVQVIADENFAAKKIIYAASDTAGLSIKKWQIGTSTAWSNILDYVPGGVYGLAVNEGVFYALEFNPGTRQSTLWYITSPATSTGTSSSWSYTSTNANTDVDDDDTWLNAVPRALVVSPSKAWAVKTNGVNKLYSFNNVLPENVSLWPAEGYLDRVNQKMGLAYDIVFGWPRILQSTAYEIQIAFDSNFTNTLAIIPVASAEPQVSIAIGPGQTGAALVYFEPGTTCYWRMRTTQPGCGAFSEVRSFTIEPVASVCPRLLTPASGSSGLSRKPAFSWEPVSGAREYEFVLDDNVAMTSPLIDTRISTSAYLVTEALDYGRTYFWRARTSAPTVGAWTNISSFTVMPEKTEAAAPPPEIIHQETAVVEIPTPPAPTSLLYPPPVKPEPVVPAYVNAALIIAFALLLAVLFLVLRPLFARPPSDYSAGVKKPGPLSFRADFILKLFKGRRSNNKEHRNGNGK